MNKPFPFVIAGFACSLALSGCANKEQQLQGKWHATKVNLQGELASSPASAMITGALQKSTLELTPDKKFNLMAGQSISGEWAMSGNSASLTPKTFGGKSIDEIKQMMAKMPSQVTASLSKLSDPMTATTDDGKTMTITNFLGQPGSITFEKDAASN